mgnify:CR=1 FL=1
MLRLYSVNQPAKNSLARVPSEVNAKKVPKITASKA